MTEQEYQQDQADRKAAAEAYEARKSEVLPGAIKAANKVLAQVKKAAKAHGHALKVVAPSWVASWGSAGDDGLPTVTLHQQVYCTECFRSADIYCPEFKQEGRRFGLASRLCREACGRPTSAAAKKECDQMQSIHDLWRLLKPGATVFTNLRSVSSSGMSRHISVHIITEGRWQGKREVDLRDISGMVARALDYKQGDRDGALVVGGCGMDMGFHVVHSLSYALHWYFPYRNAPSGSAKGSPGYTLQQEWL